MPRKWIMIKSLRVIWVTQRRVAHKGSAVWIIEIPSKFKHKINMVIWIRSLCNFIYFFNFPFLEEVKSGVFCYSINIDFFFLIYVFFFFPTVWTRGGGGGGGGDSIIYEVKFKYKTFFIYHVQYPCNCFKFFNLYQTSEPLYDRKKKIGIIIIIF